MRVFDLIQLLERFSQNADVAINGIVQDPIITESKITRYSHSKGVSNVDSVTPVVNLSFSQELQHAVIEAAEFSLAGAFLPEPPLLPN